MALPQPLHIFRKDLLHLWPETLLVVLLFVACAWSAPSGWAASPFVGYLGILSAFLKYFLMPVSWLVLISRLVQDESLVGDRQFWTSRPYHWASLFASKILYIVVFLYVPFFLMQIYLLKHAGLYPTTVLPALFHNLLLLTVIIVIPLTAVAAVTGTFARMLLSVLGAMIGILILAALFGYLTFGHLPPPQLQPILITVFIVLPLAALIYQYATRKTSTSRILLAATPVIIFLLIFFTPASALIRHAFPVASSSDPKLGSLPDEFAPRTPTPGNAFIVRNQAVLNVPFAVTGVDKDSNYAIEGASITIDTPNGYHYSSPFVGAQGQINASSPFSIVQVAIPADVFSKVKSTPADIHLSLATSHLKAEPAQTWKATLLPFAVPGHGVCSYPPDSTDAAPVCRYPFKAPELNLVTAPVAVNSCAQSASPQPVQGQGTLGGQPGLLDFDPVITTPLNLQPRQQVPPGYTFLLCPGTPLSFVEAKEQGKARFELDEKHLTLDNYAVRQPLPGAGRRGPQAEAPPPSE